MTEKEYKDYIYKKAEEVRTKEQLDALLKEVVNDKNLDYGKIVYAMSACMIATSKYIDRSEVGGITGFQASFIGWEMIKEFFCGLRDFKTSLKIVNYDDMLYPQYENKFQKTISKDIWDKMQQEAAKNLKECRSAHPEVIKHWESIVNGIIPFDYTIEEEAR